MQYMSTMYFNLESEIPSLHIFKNFPGIRKSIVFGWINIKFYHYKHKFLGTPGFLRISIVKFLGLVLEFLALFNVRVKVLESWYFLGS